MEIIHQASSGPSAGIPVYLICVIRDEELLLPYFIEYYRELGVTHFIFIDNGSIDGGPAFLANLRGINPGLRPQQRAGQNRVGDCVIHPLVRKKLVRIMIDSAPLGT